MTASAGQLNQFDTVLHFKTPPTSGTIDYDALAGSGKLVDDATLVGDVQEVAELDFQSNVSAFTVFGDRSEKYIVGSTSISPLSFAVALDNSNSVHRSIQGLAVNTMVELGIVQRSGAGKSTVDYVVGRYLGYTKGPYSGDQPTQITFMVQPTVPFAQYDEA